MPDTVTDATVYAVITPAECLASKATEWGSSRWSAHRNCELSHDLRYRLRIVPRAIEFDPYAFEDDPTLDDAPESPIYFEVGGICHAVLQYVGEAYLARQRGEKFTAVWTDVIEAAGAADAGRNGAAFDVASIYEAERLMAAYWAHWGFDNAGWPEHLELVSTEQHFEAAAGVWGQHPYTARADAILRYRDTGELVIADTKTRAAAIPGSTQRKPPNEAKRRKYARGLRTRPQFCGLVSLADKLLTHSAENPPALLVNAIIKTKVPTFDRLLVHYTRRDLEWWQASQQACSRRGFSEIPLPNPEACAPEIGSRCSYFQWCHGTDDERQKFYEEQKS